MSMIRRVSSAYVDCPDSIGHQSGRDNSKGENTQGHPNSKDLALLSTKGKSTLPASSTCAWLLRIFLAAAPDPKCPKRAE
eukprot:131216-Amphidinium_carterae.1